MAAAADRGDAARPGRAPDSIAVLMIEDDDDDALLVRGTLAGQAEPRVALTRAASLEAGLAAVERNPDCVVLLDLGLPDSVGLPTFRTFHERFPSVPVVVLSGTDDGDVAAQAVSEGAQDYLSKGRLDGELLGRAIRYALQRQRLVAQLRDGAAEVEAARRRFETIVHNNADAILILDRAGRVLFANPAASALYGMPPEKLVGLPFGVPLETGVPAELSVLRGAGRGIGVEVRSVGIVWDGRPCYLATLRDVSRRRAAEDALCMYRDRLEELVMRRTNELTQTNRRLATEIAEREKTEQALRAALSRLQEHDQSRSQFVSNVSHELKTPLASITYAVDNMLKGVVGPLPERAAKYLGMIREDASRLSATVSDILDLSRVDSHTLVLRKAVLPLGRLVVHAVESLRGLAERKGLQLRLAVPDQRVFALVDPQKLDRVVLNIVDNAIKYTPDGGVIDVRIGRDEASGCAEIAVTDDGIGIAAEHLPRVTERYFRVGDHVSGTGLGLSLCKELVDLHGGTIVVASPPPGRERGTRVCVRLPAAPAPLALVVDDEELVRRQLDAQLGRHGYRVAACGTAAEALARIHECRPDILIIDMLLGGADGIDVIGRVRAEADMRAVPIVVITGAAIDPERRGILNGFGIPVLAKPWRSEELTQVVEDAAVSRQYLHV